MKNIIAFNSMAMPVLFNNLNVNELKLLFVLIYYLSSTGKTVFINNPDTREWLSNYGFKRTPNRVASILSSLENKKMLVTEGSNVYSINKNILATIK